MGWMDRAAALRAELSKRKAKPYLLADWKGLSHQLTPLQRAEREFASLWERPGGFSEREEALMRDEVDFDSLSPQDKEFLAPVQEFKKRGNFRASDFQRPKVEEKSALASYPGAVADVFSGKGLAKEVSPNENAPARAVSWFGRQVHGALQPVAKGSEKAATVMDASLQGTLAGATNVAKGGKGSVSADDAFRARMTGEAREGSRAFQESFSGNDVGTFLAEVAADPLNVLGAPAAVRNINAAMARHGVSYAKLAKQLGRDIKDGADVLKALAEFPFAQGSPQRGSIGTGGRKGRFGPTPAAKPDVPTPIVPQKIDIKVTNREGDVAGALKNLPEVKSGFKRLYRASSPTQKFDDVFDASKGYLDDYKPKEGAVGEYYTDDLGEADYYRDAYNANRDASISYVDVPVEYAEGVKSAKNPNEFFVDLKAAHAAGPPPRPLSPAPPPPRPPAPPSIPSFPPPAGGSPYKSPFPAGMKLERPSVLSKAKEVLATIKNQATRTFEHLPHGGRFGPVIDEFTRLKKSSSIAADQTVRDLSAITDGLSPDDYRLMADKAIFDDFQQDVSRGLKEIPFYGKDHAKFATDKAALDAKLAARPDIAARLQQRKQVFENVKGEYVKAMDEIGMDVSHIQNRDDYFRHIVLDYADPKTQMGSGRLKTPGGRGFLKGREGTSKAINTDLIQADFDVIAKMRRDIDAARAIKLIRDQHDIAPKLAAEAKAAGLALDDAIPEGYAAWSPGMGHPFDIGTTKGAQGAQQAIEDAAKALGVDPKKIKLNNLQMVVPEEIAKTLDGMGVKALEARPIYSGLKSATSYVKQWLLGRPSNFVDYNLRNLTGDAEAIFVGNTSGFKKVPQAFKELREPIWTNKPMTGEVAEWAKRGGLSGQQVAELGELSENAAFKALEKGAQSQNRAVRFLAAPVKKYWELSRKLTDWREAAFRYANYLDYLDQLKAGKLKNYGASIPAEVDALTDPRDKAFKLANELLGAYDKTSVTGARIADVAIPFWRWNEVNATRTVQLLKNATADGKAMSTIGKKLGAKSVGAAIGAGKFFVKGSALLGALYAYNNTFFRDEEKDLDDFTKGKPHIILGRDKEGRVRVLDGLGMMGDLLGWVGMDKNIPVVRDWIRGRTSLMSAAQEVAKAPVQRVVNSANPLLKAPLEQLTGEQFFPDPFNPRPIRDRGQAIASSFALQDEYDLLAGKPSEGYLKKKASFLGRGVDPGASAFQDIRSAKYRFLAQKGKGGGGTPTPKSNALYEYKKALRYGDAEAAKKYLAKWESLDGDIGKLDKALEEAGPLGGMTNAEEAEFLEKLTPQEREKLQKAEKYWSEVSSGAKLGDAPATAQSPAASHAPTPPAQSDDVAKRRRRLELELELRRRRKAAGK